MENKNIKSSLDFLIKEYGCRYLYKNDYGDFYVFNSDDLKVSIFEWKQFNELDINIVYDMENYHIDPYIEEPLLFKDLQNKRKGIKGLFYDYDKSFWDITAKIIKNKIKKMLI